MPANVRGAESLRQSFSLEQRSVIPQSLPAILPKAIGMAISVFGLALSLFLFSLPLGPWSAGELLINYSGGFVRRGLFGEFFSLTPQPLLAARVTQTFVALLFLVFLGILISSLADTRFALTSAFVFIFAPGGLLTMFLGGFEYLDRKEIWFYLVLLVIIFAAWRWGFGSIKFATLSTLMSVAMILHHELFFIFFAIPVTGLWLLFSFAKFPLSFWGPATYGFVSLLAFFLVNSARGSVETVEAIYSSYRSTDAEGVTGGIEAIGWNLAQATHLSQSMLSWNNFLYWGFFLGLSMVHIFLLVWVGARGPREGSVLVGIILWQLAATGLAAYLGWDWGRWVSLFVFSSALLIALYRVSWPTQLGEEGRGSGPAARGSVPPRWRANTKYLVVIFLLCGLSLASFSTRMSHCCNHSSGDIFDYSLVSKIFTKNE